jgi:hypothetical protein
MTSSQAEVDETVKATSVRVADDIITVELDDGRTISVPTAWYPRLQHATAKERSRYEIDSVGVTWPDVEADFSIKGILNGRKSSESPECFKFWLDRRKNGKRVTVEQWLNLKRRSREGASGSRRSKFGRRRVAS